MQEIQVENIWEVLAQLIYDGSEATGDAEL